MAVSCIGCMESWATEKQVFPSCVFFALRGCYPEESEHWNFYHVADICSQVQI